MAGEQDDSGRFDYLFELLDDDVANTEGIVAPTVEQSDADERRSRTAATRIGIAAVVMAMIAVAIATVLFLLQRPNPASRLDVPTSPSEPPSVEPIATTEPVFHAPPQVSASSIEPARPTAVVVPQPQVQPQLQPQPTPTMSADAREPMTPSPTIRPPISVEPEPHPPFPNQNPSGGDNEDGGLLPGLGGLPGPL